MCGDKHLFVSLKFSAGRLLIQEPALFNKLG